MLLTEDDVPKISPFARLMAGWKIAFLFIGFCVFVWYSSKVVFFQRQTVRVERVEFLCYAKLYRKRSMPFEKIVASEPTADCAEVKRFVDRQYRGSHRYWHLVAGFYASFRYHSPADDLVYVGRIKRDKNDQGRPIAVSDEISLYASRWNPTSYTDLMSPTWP